MSNIWDQLRHGAATLREAWHQDRKAPGGALAADHAAFLPGLLEITDSPPPRLTMALPLALAGLVVGALTYAALGTIEIASIADGRIIPSGKVKQVQPADDGVVRAIHVQEGQRVRAGDPVLELDPTETAADRTRLAEQWLQSRLDIARLRALLGDLTRPDAQFQAPTGATPAQIDLTLRSLQADALQHQNRIASADAEIGKASAARDQIRAQIRKLEAMLPLVEARTEARNALAEKQIVSRTAQLELQQTLVEMTSELAVQRQALKHAETDIALARERRSQVENDFRRDRLNDLVTKEKDLATLAQDLAKAETRNRRQTLTAPADGVVQDLAANTIGGVVKQADILMRIVPANSRLEVEARIQNKDIGFVAPGQRVQVKLETFPFLIYGAIGGHVTDVARDVSSEDRGGGPIYKARIALDRDDMPVGSRAIPLTPGMAATVDIATGDRRILEYLLAPVLKRAVESLRER